MNLNSTIATLICNIKVAIKHHKEYNKCVYSKLNVSVLTKLVEKGVIEKFRVYEIRKGIQEIEFFLCMFNNESLMSDIKMISKPGQKIYTSYKDIIRYLKFFNNALVSTNQGILDQSECYKAGLGGEVLLIYR